MSWRLEVGSLEERLGGVTEWKREQIVKGVSVRNVEWSDAVTSGRKLGGSCGSLVIDGVA
jgi:hypothetical protein